MSSPILTEMIQDRAPRPRGGPEVPSASPAAHAAEPRTRGSSHMDIAPMPTAASPFAESPIREGRSVTSMSTKRQADSSNERKVPARFRTLPERIDPKKMVTSKESEPPGDPQAGHDTNRDFMLRYAG